MMRHLYRYRASFLLGLATFISCVSKSQYSPINTLETSDGFNSEMVDSLASFISFFPDETQMSIALVNSDKIYSFGAVRRNNTLSNIENADSLFEIGSITKVFTSTLFAEAVHMDSMTADRPIQDYFLFKLKSPERDGKVVTLLMLSNHTSGLPRIPEDLMWESAQNPENPYAGFTDKRLEAYLKNKLKLLTTPGTQYAYSNLGAGLLGYLVGQEMQTSYDQLLKDRIFDKYNMPSSTTSRLGVKGYLVPGRNATGNITSNWDMNVLMGAGGIISNVKDLSQFILANFADDPVLDMQREPTFKVNDNMSIGMGWHIINLPDGQKVFFHNGGTGGYKSCLVMNTEKETAVVILTNISAFHPNAGKLDSLGFQLLKMNESGE